VVLNRSVEWPHYHIWTDALHARDLARVAPNSWDLGTYVRWTVNTAWTAFEMACEEALASSGLGRRFKSNLDQAFQDKGLPKLDWGQGVWQRVEAIHALRKAYVHPGIPQERLFAPLDEAEEAISVLREAIKDVYRRVGLPIPDWPDDDQNPEPPQLRPAQVGIPGIIVTGPGVSVDDPDVVKVTYVVRGEEKLSDVCPPGTDWEPKVQNLIRNLRVAASAIRVYQGTELVAEIELRMRGS
jgi:hypothetical protein